jgi:hypothetical protein
MKRIDQEQDTVASFSRLRKPRELATYRPEASSGRTSASSVESLSSFPTAAASTPTLQYSNAPSLRPTEVEDDDENEAPIHFCGLSLELFAGSVMNTETVLPKAVKTAGLMMPRVNWGYASDASPRRAAMISLERRVVSKQ